MRHKNRSRKLGVKKSHRIAMLRNLTLGLIEHGRIKTTVARAKTLRPFVEKLVTRLKEPTVPNIRNAVSTLGNKGGVAKIAQDISPKFKARNGGYLRIMRLSGHRAGDAADMALIEWVDESLVTAYQEVATEKKAPAKKKAASKKAAAKKSAPKAKKAASEDAPKKKAAK